MSGTQSEIPVLDLSWADDPQKKPALLKQLHAALFNVGFLYIINHGVPQHIIANLVERLPNLFDLPSSDKAKLSKINSPHFLGYSGFAEETTLGKQDLREQFDFATELPVLWRDRKQVNGDTVHVNGDKDGRDFTQLYWRLRGPNQWPSEEPAPGFRDALCAYHDAVQEASYRFVHLIEEAFDIPVGTFDTFFSGDRRIRNTSDKEHLNEVNGSAQRREFLPPQHRIKLVRYPPSQSPEAAQGVGAHKDSSGWLTFLYQVGNEKGLEVLSASGDWLPALPLENSFVVNFGNAFEAATEGAVKATIHRVIAPGPQSNVRYSIPFFQGLPLDMTVSEVRGYIPEKVRSLRRNTDGDGISSFLDPRWDSLGESQLRKWVRSHKDVGLKWYGQDAVDYYTQ